MSGYSFSKIELFCNCPAAYKMRYIDGIPSIPNQYVIIGRLAHKAVAEYMKHLRKTGQKTDLDAWKKITQRTLMEANEFADELSAIFDKAENLTLPVDIVEVEKTIKIDESGKILQENDFDYYFMGVIDMAYQVSKTQAVVVDWKTSRSEDYLNYRQIQIYAWLMSHVYPDVEEFYILFHFLRTNRKKKEKVYKNELSDIDRWIKEKIYQIENETKWKATPGQACSLCDYITSCPVLSYSLKNRMDVIADQEQAIKGAKMLRVLQEAEKSLKKSLEQYVNINGPVEIDGMELGYHEYETVKFPDSKAKGDLAKFLISKGMSKDDVWEIFNVSKTSVKTGLTRAKRPDLLDEALSFGEKNYRSEFKFKKKEG